MHHKRIIHKRKYWYIGPHQINNICSLKDSVKRMKRQATDWKKIFVNDVYVKRMVFRIFYKKLTTQQEEKQCNFLNGQKKKIEQILHKGSVQMTNKDINKRSKLLVIREMPFKPQWITTASHWNG